MNGANRRKGTYSLILSLIVLGSIPFYNRAKNRLVIWVNGNDDAAKTAILIWYLIERCLTYLQIGLEFSGDSFNTSKFLNDHLRAQHHICVVWILVVVIKDYNITIWKSRGQSGQNWNTYLSSSASYLNFPLLTMRFSPISVNSISFCLLISLCL